MINIPDSFPSLRDYQRLMYEKSFNCQENHINQLPTGTGKGNLLLYQAIESVRQGKSVMIVVPSIDLVNNLKDRLKAHCPMLHNIGSYIGGNYRINKHPVFLIGVYKSISSRLNKLPYFAKIIHDECHHVAASSWSKIADHYSSSSHIGYTATPTRLDGKPLDSVFSELHTSYPVRWFIDRGYLSDFTLDTIDSIDIGSKKSFNDNLALQQRIMSDKKLVGKLVENYMENARGKKTLVFATGIDHCFQLKDEFNKALNGSGHYFEVLYSGKYQGKSQTYRERQRIIEAYKAGKIKGIINVQIVTEGVDIPDAEVCILGRLTQSTSLYLQMVGRVLRYQENKIASIYDHAGNALLHGAPDFNYDWNLKGLNSSDKNTKVCCKACQFPLVSHYEIRKMGDEGLELVCPICGFDNYFLHIPNPKDRLNPEEVSGKLVKFDVDEDDYKVYKILNSRLWHGQKIDAILELKIDDDIKRKALHILDVPDSAIDVYVPS